MDTRLIARIPDSIQTRIIRVTVRSGCVKLKVSVGR